MSTKASIQIHAFTNGDVQLDQLINAIDNPISPAIVYVEIIPSNVSTIIYNPFQQLIPNPGVAVTNMLIIPDPANNSNWTLSTLPTPPNLLFHPTNPLLISLVSLGEQLYIHHVNPTPVTFRFFWI